MKQRKKLFEKWQKLLLKMTTKAKVVICNNVCPDTFQIKLKDDTPWSIEDYEAVFQGKGTIIQPIPENKPKSRMIITEFKDFESVRELYAKDEAEIAGHGYKFELWRKGNFSHSTKLRDHPAKLQSLHVKHDKSVLSLFLEFTMAVVRDVVTDTPAQPQLPPPRRAKITHNNAYHPTEYDL